MSHTVTFKMNGDLLRQVRAYAKKRSFNQSAALRDLLRAGLRVPLKERAYAEAYADAQRRIAKRLAEVVE